MKTRLFAVLIGSLSLLALTAAAQDQPVMVIYQVQSVTPDAGATTLALEVAVVLGGAAAIRQLALQLASPTGDTTGSQGQIAIDAVDIGQMAVASGSLSAPSGFWGQTLDTLAFRVSYVNAQGQTETHVVQGTRRN